VTNVGIRCGAVVYLFHRMHGSFSIAHTSARRKATHNGGWNADTTAVQQSTSDCTGADSEGNTSGRPLRKNPDVPSQSWSSVSPWATSVIRAPHIHCATTAIAASMASMCVCVGRLQHRRDATQLGHAKSSPSVSAWFSRLRPREGLRSVNGVPSSLLPPTVSRVTGTVPSGAAR
jgi:hypothetical protein